ncbi:MAG TPA: BTAD domain-containing putative transcriptional regulator [Streptosporangiaceae bacterium]|nr:BTAD domain-containing putative transcriptional regulator [Streptosporangiaceae bacterium]
MAADAVAAGTELAEFGILGPLEVWRCGRAVRLGGPRQRAVLALLLLEANRVVSLDRLAEDIWGGHPPEGWVTTVQIYVSHLRQALEPDRVRGAAGEVLVTRGRGYLLRVDGERLDAARFQDGFAAGRAALEAGRFAEAADTLRQALGLWRGGVLADLADYAFTRPEVARLEELRLAATEALIDADLALGRHDALTAELEQLAAEHPMRERLHGQLMLALYRCGRQADALAAYSRVRGLLADELGIDPGEPLQRMHAAVLAHDPALDWPGDREDAADGHHGAEDTGPVASPAPESPVRPAGLGRPPGWARRRGRRLLVIGSAVALAAAACVVAVARPWAGAPAGLPADSVGLIGPSGDRVGGPVSVASPAGLAYGDGSIWAVDSADGTLARIDPATHAVQQIPVGSAPSAVAITGPDAWVTNSGDGTVSRVSTAVNRVVDTIQVGILPVAIASGPSGVWVANEGDDTVDRIDPKTGTVTKGGIQVGGGPDGIAVGPDAVWVANVEDGTVQRIDPVTDQADGPVHVGSGPAGIAVTPGAVWVANSLDLTVSKLDPATGTLTGTVNVGDGPNSIVAAGNSLWVSDEFGATLDRIDLRTAQVVRTFHLGSSPRGMAVAGSGVWVAARPFPSASHRGGTLTVADTFLPDPSEDPPDPAVAYPADGTLTAAYDGLTAFRRSGGVAGLTLVPDLATTLPRPTAGGTTYTFTLRRGIRYSNGNLVRASDFRRGIQRQLSFGATPDYYKGILGGSACIKHPNRCDLSAGIVTDDAAGRITFRLVQADPDFLYKLGLLLAVPAPPGTPNHVIHRAPFLPGTGPYMISQLRPHKSFTLVRNPYFRQWSYAAQPAGYPSVIRYEQVKSQSAQESAVITGHADLADLEEGDLQSLAIQYPARVYFGLKQGTEYASLNTRQPPFTNLKARQAVNYAIDRARIMQFFHFASGQATATCQMLPPAFPGHQGYCPYTTGAGDGAWHGPDMERARRLVRESGTMNLPVTVWSQDDRALKAAGSYLVGLLDDLGYRARLHTVSADNFFGDIYNPGLNIQVSIMAGWGADYPAPSTFFGPLLSCQSADEPGTNSARFCDPQVDALASQALAAQAADPAAARRLWAQADHIVTDQAPYVPVYNRSFAGFVSSRLGNYQTSPVYGLLVDQMWVR